MDLTPADFCLIHAALKSHEDMLVHWSEDFADGSAEHAELIAKQGELRDLAGRLIAAEHAALPPEWRPDAQVAELEDELRYYVERIGAATSCEEIGLIYMDMVGYDSHLESPDVDLEALRGDALDYVREVCYSHGIPVGTVGITQ